MKSYTELSKFETLEERMRYCQTHSRVGDDKFGNKRYLNQLLYKSEEWQKARRDVIIRDDGCELGHSDYPIQGQIYVHHLNEITVEDILNRNPKVFDLDNLVCTSRPMHYDVVHYGDEESIQNFLGNNTPIERKRGDTTLW